jgi:hypothetical protein
VIISSIFIQTTIIHSWPTLIIYMWKFLMGHALPSPFRFLTLARLVTILHKFPLTKHFLCKILHKPCWWLVLQEACFITCSIQVARCESGHNTKMLLRCLVRTVCALWLTISHLSKLVRINEINASWLWQVRWLWPLVFLQVYQHQT